MSGKSVALLILAVMSGLGAMYGTSKLLSKNRNPAVVMQDVLVAARDLKVEEVLKPDMVKVTQIPKSNVPVGAYTSFKDVEDRWVQIKTLEGEPIIDPKLAPKGSPAGLVSRIPKGMRAFAVEVTESTGVSGFILPDHRVDVVQIMPVPNNSTRPPEAETILQDLLVLASGQTLTRTEDKSILSRTVTLAVSPDQVDVLVAARSRGSLTLALRGVNDHVQAKRPVVAAPKVDQVSLLVAATDLDVNQPIMPEMVKLADFPRSIAPPHTLSNYGQLGGRKAQVKIFAGEPLLDGKLAFEVKVAAQPVAEAPKPVRIGPGMRAITIKVDELSMAGEAVRRGQHVDVFYTGAGAPAAEGKPANSESKLILQDLLVLSPEARAKGVDGSDAPKSPGLVTLEVPIGDVGSLRTFQASGSLSLAVRSADDRGRFEAATFTPAVARHGTIYRGGLVAPERYLIDGAQVPSTSSPSRYESAAPGRYSASREPSPDDQPVPGS